MNQLRAGMERAAGICAARAIRYNTYDSRAIVTRDLEASIRAAMPPLVRPSPEAESEAIDRIRAICAGESCTVDAIQAVLDDLYAEEK